MRLKNRCHCLKHIQPFMSAHLHTNHSFFKGHIRLSFLFEPRDAYDNHPSLDLTSEIVMKALQKNRNNILLYKIMSNKNSIFVYRNHNYINNMSPQSKLQYPHASGQFDATFSDLHRFFALLPSFLFCLFLPTTFLHVRILPLLNSNFPILSSQH